MRLHVFLHQLLWLLVPTQTGVKLVGKKMVGETSAKRKTAVDVICKCRTVNRSCSFWNFTEFHLLEFGYVVNYVQQIQTAEDAMKETIIYIKHNLHFVI